ncbi:MAG: hypothetical protein EA385_13935 [Salinarimonadaceae bacterium]|nr:MAG: hypothetical protein EA385_13935 [Salinarimonadaceae bacterium]
MAQLHIVMVDVAAEDEEAFHRWYDETHLPDILACPGWLSARRFINLEGGPRFVAVYEITGPDAYETPEFHAIKGFGPFEGRVSNFTRLRLSPFGGQGVPG